MIPPIADRFVAGETATAAIDHARALNRSNIGAILNRLGEHYHDPAPARADTEAYLDLLQGIEASGVDATISAKPSQVGFDVSKRLFRDNLERIVDAAAARDVFVWLDMEDHETTDGTIDAYRSLAPEHPGGVGVCLQSNLRRTRGDLEDLRDVPGMIRLVKGAYDEPGEIAYTKTANVDERYRSDLEYAFAEFDGPASIAVATHDPAMIEHAIALHDEYGTDFEFQMLMGVREDEQERLANEGYDVSQYVPYGEKWLSYFSRRIRERKENATFALRAIFG